MNEENYFSHMRKSQQRKRSSNSDFRRSKNKQILAKTALALILIVIVGSVLGVVWSGVYAPVEYTVTITDSPDVSETDEVKNINDLSYRDKYLLSNLIHTDTKQKSVPFWHISPDLSNVDTVKYTTEDGVKTIGISVNDPIHFTPIIFVMSLVSLILFSFLYLFVRYEIDYY